MKKVYIKPELRVVELQHQCHILAVSGEGKYSYDYEVRSVRGDSFSFCGGDDEFDEDAR